MCVCMCDSDMRASDERCKEKMKWKKVKIYIERTPTITIRYENRRHKSVCTRRTHMCVYTYVYIYMPISKLIDRQTTLVNRSLTLVWLSKDRQIEAMRDLYICTYIIHYIFEHYLINWNIWTERKMLRGSSE